MVLIAKETMEPKRWFMRLNEGNSPLIDSIEGGDNLVPPPKRTITPGKWGAMIFNHKKIMTNFI